MGNSFSTTSATAATVFGTRTGMEEKCGGARNLETYELQPPNSRESTAGMNQIAASIQDDLEEANADMSVAWREFTDVSLGYLTSYELRWLNDTAEYGAVVKAWAGRNIGKATGNEEQPIQIARAEAQWDLRLQMLREGRALKDYYAGQSDSTPDLPAGTFQDVQMVFTGDTEEHSDEFGS